MAKVNNNYRKYIKPFWKSVNWSIKSSVRNRIKTLTDGSGNSFSNHAGKLKILKSHFEKLHVGSELHMKSFYDSWKEEVSNLVKLNDTMSFQDLDSNGILAQPLTLERLIT